MNTVVYQAPDDTPHYCDLKNYEHLPLTSIVRCDECGTYWERKNVIGDWTVGRWRRVTRWNRAARRRIGGEPQRDWLQIGQTVSVMALLTLMMLATAGAVGAIAWGLWELL